MNPFPYIKFDELMASVESDFSTYAKNNYINRGNYIKVVQKINHDLGLKIFKEKELTLEIENHKAKLPEGFLYLQLALVCGGVRMHSQPVSFGTTTQEVPAEYCSPLKSCLGGDEKGYWVTQIYKEKQIPIYDLQPVRINPKSSKFCSDNCVNLNNKKFYNSDHELTIQSGEIITGFEKGNLYINYLSDMQDEEGNLLLYSHPKLIPYYEYGVKKAILENIWIDGDDALERKWGAFKNELKEARIEALNFINTIEYDEIQKTFAANRKRFYNKYQRMFYTV